MTTAPPIHNFDDAIARLRSLSDCEIALDVHYILDRLEAAADSQREWGRMWSDILSIEAKLETALRKVRSEELANMILNTDKERAEATIKAISELPDKWREDCCASIGMVKLAVELKADELQAIINGENHDYNQM